MSDNRTDEQADFTKKVLEKLHTCARNRDDIQIFGVDYVACPLDAEGEPILIDDHMVLGCSGRDLGRVWAISGDTIMFEKCFKDGCSHVECFDSSRLVHYRKTSEEELLDEYRAAVLELRQKMLTGMIEYSVYDRELSKLTRACAINIRNDK